MPGEHVCRHTAYESPERHQRYNMHGLKQQNAFGWTDITCTCLIYLFLFLFECHFTFSDRQNILTEILFKVALNTINQPTSF